MSDYVKMGMDNIPITVCESDSELEIPTVPPTLSVRLPDVKLLLFRHSIWGQGSGINVLFTIYATQIKYSYHKSKDELAIQRVAKLKGITSAQRCL